MILAFALIFFFGVASPEARDRITDDDGGSGRTDIWKVGWRMVEAHPLTRRRRGNFQRLLDPLPADRAGGLAADEFIVDNPAVAHNSTCRSWPRLGIVGLALFLGIVGACIAAANRRPARVRIRAATATGSCSRSR